MTTQTDNPHLETLIVSHVLRGKGIDNTDPVRRVLQIHSMEGELIAENDALALEPMHRFAAKLEARINHLEQCCANYKATVEELQAELRAKKRRK